MSASQSDIKPLILVAWCGGGWHRETVKILEQIPGDDFRFAYAYGHCQGVHGAANLPTPHPGETLPIHYLGPTRKTAARWIAQPVRFACSIVEAFRIVRQTRPQFILAVGSATAIPLFIAGRCFGANCIFIESLTRVNELSLTGRIIHRLSLADRLYVQWQRLQQHRRGTVYAGAVL